MYRDTVLCVVAGAFDLDVRFGFDPAAPAPSPTEVNIVCRARPI